MVDEPCLTFCRFARPIVDLKDKFVNSRPRATSILVSILGVTLAFQPIIAQAEQQGMKAVIPPRKNRIVQRDYDRHLYKQRHLVENAFLHIKQWRGIATRYAKRLSSFLAAVQIRCLVMWLRIS